MAMNVKKELIDPSELPQSDPISTPTAAAENNAIVAITSSGSTDFDSDSDDSSIEGSPMKRRKIEDVLPIGFLDPLPPEERLAMQRRMGVNKSSVCIAIAPAGPSSNFPMSPPDGDGKKSHSFSMKKMPREGVAKAGSDSLKSCKQFWKAGDYEGAAHNDDVLQTVGMDHLRVHPRFLHSNATSHKWALGAFAELLDNALDEVSNGATYVHIDMLKNKKDDSAMLVIEDNGGGMTPDKIRQCMSLGYSEKSKLANTIGQYGNGFKTSTMRLGADVIVFSRCQGKDMKRPTQSIGMLSYTFLRKTGKEDIVVPMVDYEKKGKTWETMTRSSSDDWKRNLETIVQWTPYESEEDLLEQFDYLKDQGTRIVIYNLWEDDQGKPELDFDSDEHDIQIRGVNRDEKKIAMAKEYPNSRHFLTYRHSLRNYASILYLRIPPNFRMILRGKDVDHHNIVNDMMYSKEITYRPQGIPEEAPKDPNMFALLTIGFVKDATYHIDVQGFNVYHKNRLIKPFWRVWNAAGSDGRGVIGVLEANFVEPAHDKQSFERTIVFSRLEARLVAIQKNYWTTNCHLVGYAKRRISKNSIFAEKKATASVKDNSDSPSNSDDDVQDRVGPNLRSKGKGSRRSSTEDEEQDEAETIQKQLRNECKGFSTSGKAAPEPVSTRKTNQISRLSAVKKEKANEADLELVNLDTDAIVKLKEENQELKNGLEDILHDLQFERDRTRSLENQLQEKDNIITSLLEERNRRDIEEETLRNKLKGAADTIEGLCNKVKSLQSYRALNK